MRAPPHSYLKPAPPRTACSFVTARTPRLTKWAAAVVDPRLVMVVVSALRSLRDCYIPAVTSIEPCGLPAGSLISTALIAFEFSLGRV